MCCCSVMGSISSIEQLSGVFCPLVPSTQTEPPADTICSGTNGPDSFSDRMDHLLEVAERGADRDRSGDALRMVAIPKPTRPRTTTGLDPVRRTGCLC